ncbi:MAG: SLC13 family permease [Rhodospirillaceae bacterium]
MSPRLSFAITVCAGLAAVAVAVLPAPDGIRPTAMHALALTLFTVTMWATGALPAHAAALVFFLVASVFAVAPPKVVFAGFQSSAWWLVFSGLVIGAAADVSGLGQWVARHAFRHAGVGYTGLIAAILIGAVVLCFIIPSSVGRMAIAIPAVAAIAAEAGHKAGSPGHDGTLIAVVFGSFVLAFGIMPANLINILVTGTAETLLGVHVTYGEYLLMQFPVNTLAKGLIMAGLLIRMFRPQSGGQPVRAAGPEPLGRDGRILLVVVLLTLAAWTTDFLHGVQAGWVALAAALVCLVPGIGPVTAKLFAQRVDVTTLLFAGSVLGIGPVLHDSGASQLIGRMIAAVLPLGEMGPAGSYFAMAYAAAATSVVANITGAVAVVTPLAGDFTAGGLDVKTAALAQVNGLGALFFPYEALPLMVGLAMAGVAPSRVMKFCLTLAFASIAILTPLNFLWWRWLGYIPG